MAIDYGSLLFTPIYDTLSTRGIVIFEDTGSKKTLRVIDKTAGTSLAVDTSNSHFDRSGGAAIGTVVPAVLVRASEIYEKSITLDRLTDSRLAVNGKEWRIESVKPRPTLRGENDGEYWLILDFIRDLNGDEYPESESEFISESEPESFSESISDDDFLVAFEETFNPAVLSWTINHNLGYNPIVYLYSLGGMQIDGAVAHTSLNQVVVTFVTAQAGTARLV